MSTGVAERPGLTDFAEATVHRNRSVAALRRTDSYLRW